MEARRDLPYRQPAFLVVAIAAFVFGAQVVPPDESWTGNAAGDMVELGAEQSSGVQQVGSAQDGSDQDNGGHTASGPLIQSRWVPDCHDSSPYDEPMCDTALTTCPENIGLAEPVYVRLRQYQREVDRETGDPLTEWQQVGTRCLTVE